MRHWGFLAFLAIASSACGLAVEPATPDSGSAAISPELTDAANAAMDGRRDVSLPSGARIDSKGRIQIYAHCLKGEVASYRAELEAASMKIELGQDLGDSVLFQGWIPSSALPALARLSFVTRISLPSYATHQ
jgi:hypothetical protein